MIQKQVCCECGATFEGYRSAARSACWEPYSSRDQNALDHGQMVCPTCVDKAITNCLNAMRAAWS